MTGQALRDGSLSNSETGVDGVSGSTPKEERLFAQSSHLRRRGSLRRVLTPGRHIYTRFTPREAYKAPESLFKVYNPGIRLPRASLRRLTRV